MCACGCGVGGLGCGDACCCSLFTGVFMLLSVYVRMRVCVYVRAFWGGQHGKGWVHIWFTVCIYTPFVLAAPIESGLVGSHVGSRGQAAEQLLEGTLGLDLDVDGKCSLTRHSPPAAVLPAAAQLVCLPPSAPRGGLIFWADLVGADKIVAKLNQLADQFRPAGLAGFFEPCAYLKAAAASGRRLSDGRAAAGAAAAVSKL